MNISEHLLDQAEYCPSPHQNSFPSISEISLIVIHSMSLPYGQYDNDYIKQLFLGTLDCEVHPSFASLKKLRVSAHLVVRRAGSIMQFVPFDRRAWHAGKSSYQGKDSCNDFSIGIEMEGSEEDGYTDTQYEVLREVCKELIATYQGLDATRIVGHKDIAPGRKTDPWGFDWTRLQGLD